MPARILGLALTIVGCGKSDETPPMDDVSETDQSDVSGTDESDTTHDSDGETSNEPPEEGTEVTCLDTPPGAPLPPMARGPLEVELGVRDPETGVDFLPLDDDCGIPIGGIGQAGLTARLAVRTRYDEPVRDAYVVVTLVNFADPERDPAPNNGPGVVRRFDCREDGWCYLVPILVEISHLNRLPDLEGTVVTFSAEVTSEEDDSIAGSTYGWGSFVLEEEIAEQQ